MDTARHALERNRCSQALQDLAARLPTDPAALREMIATMDAWRNLLAARLAEVEAARSSAPGNAPGATRPSSPCIAKA